jgi:hypothetical protein
MQWRPRLRNQSGRERRGLRRCGLANRRTCSCYSFGKIAVNFSSLNERWQERTHKIYKCTNEEQNEEGEDRRVSSSNKGGLWGLSKLAKLELSTAHRLSAAFPGGLRIPCPESHVSSTRRLVRPSHTEPFDPFVGVSHTDQCLADSSFKVIAILSTSRHLQHVKTNASRHFLSLNVTFSWELAGKRLVAHGSLDHRTSEVFPFPVSQPKPQVNLLSNHVAFQSSPEASLAHRQSEFNGAHNRRRKDGTSPPPQTSRRIQIHHNSVWCSSFSSSSSSSSSFDRRLQQGSLEIVTVYQLEALLH